MAIGILPELDSDARARLGRLSAKEREVLDQILLHKPLKVIAHDLGITLSAVDQRLKTARMKLKAADRNEAARIYSGLLETYRESPCGFADMGNALDQHLFQTPEPSGGSSFMLQDSATVVVPPLWFEAGQRGSVSEVLDENFGKLWRMAAIPVLAIIIAVLALALIAMAKALGDLI